jgi:hypothetical protein
MFAKSALVLTLGALAGCFIPGLGSANRAGGPAVDPQEATTHVAENLARLQALDVFKVGRLVVDVASSATECSGPCPAAEAAVNAAQTRSATRLAKLAATAEKAAASPLPDACTQRAVAANLASLSALRIVGVSGLIVTQPANNPQCNNTPCPEDKAAAEAATCARAGKLASIAAAASEL